MSSVGAGVVVVEVVDGVVKVTTLILKFMHERSQYDTEIAMRQLGDVVVERDEAMRCFIWDAACLATCAYASLEDGDKTLKFSGDSNYRPMLASTEFSSETTRIRPRGIVALALSAAVADDHEDADEHPDSSSPPRRVCGRRTHADSAFRAGFRFKASI